MFSTKQVTTVAVSLAAAAILLPTAAVASGAQLVVIKDPTTGAKTHVAGGRLETQSLDAPESAPFARFDRATNNASDRVIIAGPTSRTIYLSSLTATARGGDVGVRIRAVEPTDGSCDAGHVVIVRGEDLSFAVPSNTSHSVEFPSPLVATPQPGKQICLIAHPDTTFVPASSATLTVSGSGYLR
jgi:hypothetical protein